MGAGLRWCVGLLFLCVSLLFGFVLFFVGAGLWGCWAWGFCWVWICVLVVLYFRVSGLGFWVFWVFLWVLLCCSCTFVLLGGLVCLGRLGVLHLVLLFGGFDFWFWGELGFVSCLGVCVVCLGVFGVCASGTALGFWVFGWGFLLFWGLMHGFQRL